MDLYVQADPARIDEAERAVRRALSRVSRIEAEYAVPRPASERTHQAFYRLEGTSPFLLVDLHIVEPVTPDKCLEPTAHGRIRVHFDKICATKAPVLDESRLHDSMQDRLGQLRGRVEVCHVFVDKELNRGRPLETLDAYQAFVLGPLVDVLRIVYTPVHYEFGLKSISREVPADVVDRLESLAFVKNGPDLRTKTGQALAWFREVSAQGQHHPSP